MFKERIYPMASIETHIVPVKQHPTWRVPGESAYEYQPIRTGFIRPGEIHNLLSICVPNKFCATDSDKISPAIGIDTVLVAATIADNYYIATIDVKAALSKKEGSEWGIDKLINHISFELSFVKGDPGIDGFLLKDLPLNITFNYDTNKFVFKQTSFGCVTVIGVALDILLTNENR